MKWSINKAATEFGVSRETVTRGLRANNTTVKAGEEFTTKQIFAALAGDFKYERTRRERAEADKTERENRVANGELLDRAAIEKKVWTDMLAPIRQEMLNLPGQVATLCNPADPETARKVLDAHIFGILQKIHSAQAEIEPKQPEATPGK